MLGNTLNRNGNKTATKVNWINYENRVNSWPPNLAHRIFYGSASSSALCPAINLSGYAVYFGPQFIWFRSCCSILRIFMAYAEARWRKNVATGCSTAFPPLSPSKWRAKSCALWKIHSPPLSNSQLAFNFSAKSPSVISHLRCPIHGKKLMNAYMNKIYSHINSFQ